MIQLKRRDARAEILAVLADNDWHTALEVRARTGLSQSAVMDHLNRMSREPWNNPMVVKEVRLRTDGYAREPGVVFPPRLRPDNAPKGRSRVQRLVHYRLREST